MNVAVAQEFEHHEASTTEQPSWWTRRWRPEVARSRDQIANGVRAAIGDCILGKSPYPLVLLGPVGVGKTCAALCVLDYFLQQYGARGLFVTGVELADRFARAKRADFWYPGGARASADELWRDWGMYQIVGVDELGTRGEASDHQRETLQMAIDRRAGRPSVFTSNLTLGQLAECHDDRIASRLAAGTVIRFEGDDRRVGQLFADRA